MQPTEQITLQKTVPPSNKLVCPGETLGYTCKSETGVLRWQTPTGIALFLATDNINTTDTVPEFDLALVNITGLTVVSTATADMVNSSDANKRVECNDGLTSLSRELLISVTLQQTVPPSNQLVCPGEKLVYTCTSETGVLRWETPTGIALFLFTDNINKTDTVPEFDLALVNITGFTVVSTATTDMVNSSDANKRIECNDGLTSLSREMLVSEKPGNCQGYASCSAIAGQDSPKSPIITISLTVYGPIHCASYYKFTLGDDVIITNETSVTFRNYSYGTPYENQEIYTLNKDRTRGTLPCYYSISVPNGIKEVFTTQNCDGNTIKLSFIYSPPTLPLGSCLNPAQLLWEYAIHLTGNVTGNFMTTENTFEVNVTQLGAFTIEITPTLHVLGLSGIPLITTLGVTALCEPESSSSAIVTGLVFGALTLVILTMLLVCMLVLRLKCFPYHHKKVSIDNSSYRVSESSVSLKDGESPTPSSFTQRSLSVGSGSRTPVPGRPVTPLDLHRKYLLERILLLLLVMHPTEQITLQQTVPPNNELVCPGEKLVYTCISDTGTLRWETPTGIAIFFSTDTVNVNATVPEFFLLVVSINGSTMVSTATANMVNSSDANIRVECRNGITSLSRQLLVSEKPGNCQAFVSCSAIASQDSSESPIITISLEVLSPINCASFYEFMLGDDVMVTNETSVTFRNYSYGTPYENQEIYVLNNDGTRGTVPCFYSLPVPNAIEEVFLAQNCNGNTIELSFIYNPPTLPLGSCLNPAQLLWEYIINLTGNITGDFVTTDNTFEVNMAQLGAFTITITPTLPVLGLSGSPLKSSLVVTALCEPELSSPGELEELSSLTTGAIAGLAIFGVLTLIMATILLVIGFLKLKSHLQKEDGNSSENGGTPKQRRRHVNLMDLSFTSASTPLVPVRREVKYDGAESSGATHGSGSHPYGKPLCPVYIEDDANSSGEQMEPEYSEILDVHVPCTGASIPLGPDQEVRTEEITVPSSACTPGATPGSGSLSRGERCPDHVVAELQSEFNKDNLPSTQRKQEIAKRLGLRYATVDSWFKRERAKRKPAEKEAQKNIGRVPDQEGGTEGTTDLCSTPASDPKGGAKETANPRSTSGATPVSGPLSRGERLPAHVVAELRSEFNKDNLPSTQRKQEIADRLGLHYTTVDSWFKRKRAKRRLAEKEAQKNIGRVEAVSPLAKAEIKAADIVEELSSNQEISQKEEKSREAQMEREEMKETRKKEPEEGEGVIMEVEGAKTEEKEWKGYREKISELRDRVMEQQAELERMINEIQERNEEIMRQHEELRRAERELQDSSEKLQDSNERLLWREQEAEKIKADAQATITKLLIKLADSETRYLFLKFAAKRAVPEDTMEAFPSDSGLETEMPFHGTRMVSYAKPESETSPHQFDPDDMIVVHSSTKL